MKPSWTGVPRALTSSTTRCVSAMVSAIGFSLPNALPARAAISIRLACVLVGVTITTASTSGWAIASSGAPTARWARAMARPRSAAARAGSATTPTPAAGGRQAVLLQQEVVRGGLAPAVVDPDPHQAARLARGEDLGHQPAQATQHRVLLDAHDEPHRPGCVDKSLRVDGLERWHVQHACGDATRVEEPGCIEAARGLRTGRDEEHVAPLTHEADPARFEAVALVEDVGARVPGEARRA